MSALQALYDYVTQPEAEVILAGPVSLIELTTALGEPWTPEKPLTHWFGVPVVPSRYGMCDLLELHGRDYGGMAVIRRFR